MHTPLTITEVFPSPLAYGEVPALRTKPAGGTATSNKPSRSRVLCFSHDRMLGETRRAVLQRQYDAVFASSLDEVSQYVSAFPLEVMVLCHTLSLEERQRCLDIAGRASPMTKVVLVASESGPCPLGIAKVVLGLAGPEMLLNAVQQVLRPAVSFVDLGSS